MKNETYYRRVRQGRRVRYEPVAMSDTHKAWPEGSHLMVCKPGVRSAWLRIEPAFADVEAAMVAVREAMAEAMLQKATPQPYRKRLTPKQQVAYVALAKAMGRRWGGLAVASIRDIIEAGLDVVRKQIKEQT